MRNLFLLSLLATSALAMPAQAQDGRRGDRPDRGERSERSERSDRSDRSERSERRSNDNSSQSSGQERERPVMRERPAEAQTVSGGSGVDRPRRQGAGDAVRAWRGNGSGDTSGTQATGDSVRDWRGPNRRQGVASAVQSDPVSVAPTEPAIDRRTIEERNLRRSGGGTFDRRVRTTPGYGGDRVRRIGRNVPTEGAAPPPVTREQTRLGTTSHRWRGDWRGDRRYDWRRYRDRNRSIFRIGFYFDPFGWNYRRYSVGWRLWPSYYGHEYWLNDPWQYRLPPAYGPYRWIRYHDDALLVNIYTGQVEDVIYNFFW